MGAPGPLHLLGTQTWSSHRAAPESGRMLTPPDRQQSQPRQAGPPGCSSWRISRPSCEVGLGHVGLRDPSWAQQEEESPTEPSAWGWWRRPPGRAVMAARVPVVLSPLLPPTASLLRVPCELVLDMGFVPALQDPASRERRGLLHSFNRTVSLGPGLSGGAVVGAPACIAPGFLPAQVAPLFMSVPGFLRLEVTGIR